MHIHVRLCSFKLLSNKLLLTRACHVAFIVYACPRLTSYVRVRSIVVLPSFHTCCFVSHPLCHCAVLLATHNAVLIKATVHLVLVLFTCFHKCHLVNYLHVVMQQLLHAVFVCAVALYIVYKVTKGITTHYENILLVSKDVLRHTLTSLKVQP